MKKIWIALLAFSMLGASISANESFFKRKKSKKKEVVEKEKTPYDKLFLSDHSKAEGFITVHKVKEKIYFELPLSLLRREMLLGSTVTEISDNKNAIIGSKPTEPIHFRFQKLNNKVCLSAIQTENVSNDKDGRLKAAIEMSNIDAILQAFDIAAYNNDSTAIVFEVTEFFVGDNKLMPPFDKFSVNTSGGRKRTTSFQSNRSFIDSFKAFKDNISVRSSLNYTYSLTGGKGSDIKDEPFTAKVTRSIVLLDSVPYRPRLMDSRIGIFPTIKKEYSATKQTMRPMYYANRWRLEPSDLEGYLAGKKVTPVKPIVFYIDSCFPESWKKSVFEAVNQWNQPFEKIGFIQAIQAKEFPKDDPEFDPDNLKYSCIRYAPVAIENAMGPSWVDPRSGEILNASVYLYHDVIKLLNNWLFIQTAQADKRVRHKIIPRVVMDDALRYVVSHEVGHCLGFMHNMSASSVIPVDSLRSPSFTQKNGTTSSIMDYARFNYVAQPGDMERGVRMTPPYFGPYDNYLIRWSYTPVPEAKTTEEEYAVTSKWITELSDNPIYRYGKQQSDILDPRSQTEDLGDNAVKATQYGVKNLKYILSNLNQWLEEEDVDYTHRSDLYDGILMQYITYMLHVYHNIGGIYMHEKLVGDKVEALQSEPKEKQKEAMDYFLEQLATLDWVDDSNTLKTLPMVGKPSDALRNVLMKLLMEAPARVEFSALKAGKTGYGVEECMNDIYTYIWSPTMKGRKLTESQMKLQNLFVKYLASTAGIRWSKETKSLVDEENVWEQLSVFHRHTHEGHSGCCISDLERMFNPVAGFDEPMAEYFVPKNQDSMCYGYFLRIRDLLNGQKLHTDKDTRLHYQLLLHQMNNALNR
ncbi:zinc-dependent metalloprotease [Bacteroides sp.]|uniref:zinc-dependent metalloprotease n=1 Tax=Bacteroides sp. TaxID=29523 RepID=UPI002616F959|nr:zinc-dependent metalloprotease [Bacteroides sp.]MDD3036509.1 zinc-dependent metalloprotease [Bacteroides sp.]